MGCAYGKFLDIPAYNASVVLCLYSIGTAIEARAEIVPDYSTTHYWWDMKFYRQQPDGSWKLGGEFSGYLASWSPSIRRLDNCLPGRWKVELKFRSDRVSDPNPLVAYINH